MDSIDAIISMIDLMTNTKSKKHILGSILLGISLFECLAITILTISPQEDYDEQ